MLDNVIDLSKFDMICEEDILYIEGGKITFEQICSGVITTATTAAGGYAGLKIGAEIGGVSGGPAGAIIGGVVGYIGGVVISNIFIKD